jgi:heterodisulfide reductase subunit B
VDFAIRETLPNLGIEVIDMEGTSCCPDPIYFKSRDKLSWLTVAARNLSIAEDLGLDVLSGCPGCTATLGESYHLLHEDEELREEVNRRLRRIGREYRGTSRVRHVVTVLRDEVGHERIRESVVRPLEGIKTAIHYGCHLLRPSGVVHVDDPDHPVLMEDLVRAVGATPVRHQRWYMCCGKASQRENGPAEMMRDLLRSLQDEGPDIITLICPTCFGQFDHFQMKVGKQYGEDFHTPPVFYMQLLALAQGVPYEKLGFERQCFKPEVLKRLPRACRPVSVGAGW